MTDQPQLVFDDGAAYERMMGDWSRRVGNVFLDWLNPDPGLRWMDVGCGNGAFSHLLFERVAPAHLSGVDPSAAQLHYAINRLKGHNAEFHVGNAEHLPVDDRVFDAAVMALVIFFVPDPGKGVREMARVVRPGGSVSTYAWDIEGGGLPVAAALEAARALGLPMPLPPRADAANIPVLEQLWRGADLTAIETRTIKVEKRYADFDDYWASNTAGPAAQALAALPKETAEELKAATRARLTIDASGEVICSARANAIKGRVPG